VGREGYRKRVKVTANAGGVSLDEAAMDFVDPAGQLEPNFPEGRHGGTQLKVSYQSIQHVSGILLVLIKDGLENAGRLNESRYRD
jgi:hypothetical protein